MATPTAAALFASAQYTAALAALPAGDTSAETRRLRRKCAAHLALAAGQLPLVSDYDAELPLPAEPVPEPVPVPAAAPPAEAPASLSVVAKAAPMVRKPKDWAALERQLAAEEKEEKVEGDAALSKMFRDIYANASEETRRAMNKSYVESNGTTLSTDWATVGAAPVVGQPPDWAVGGRSAKQP